MRHIINIPKLYNIVKSINFFHHLKKVLVRHTGAFHYKKHCLYIYIQGQLISKYVWNFYSIHITHTVITSKKKVVVYEISLGYKQSCPVSTYAFVYITY